MGHGEADVTMPRPGEDVLSMAGVLQTLGAVDSIEDVPGGLTRVALERGQLVVNSSQGGGSPCPPMPFATAPC